jgi:hypothetical protein
VGSTASIGKNGEEHRVTSQRFLVGPENDAAGGRDSLGDFGRVSGEFVNSALCRLEALRAGLGLTGAAAKR